VASAAPWPRLADAFALAVVHDKTAGHRTDLSICLAYAKEGIWLGTSCARLPEWT